MDYMTFVHDLKRYKDNKDRLKKAETELEVILYDLCGVRGISYDSIMVHGNPSQKALNWLTLEDKYNDKASEVERYRTAVENVERIKKRLPKELWLMLKEVYLDGNTFQSVGLKHGYSSNGMWQYLRREVERYLW